MLIDEAIQELYRLAETKKWDSKHTYEALAAAIDGLEHIKAQKNAQRRKTIMKYANKKQSRVWC